MDSDGEILEQMASCLSSFPDNVSALGNVLSTLETLYSLITRSVAWKERFWGLWAALEDVYAVALDRAAEVLDEESARIVAAAIAELREMVTASE